MSTEAKPVPMLTMEPEPAAITERRRGRRAAEGKEKNNSMVLFYLGESGEQNNGRIALKEKFGCEGDAMVESLKKGVPYYRIEVWQARAVVKDGAVEVRKDQISVRA